SGSNPKPGFGRTAAGNVNVNQPHKQPVQRILKGIRHLCKYFIKYMPTVSAQPLEKGHLRSGKELILATKAFAKEDRKRSWAAMLSTLFLLLALMGTALFAPWLWVKIAAGILQGLVIVRFFVIYHDYLHHTILQKSAFANAIMTAFGIYILAPKSIWKRSHDYHHNHNSKLFSASIGSYPVATRKKFESMSKGERRVYL